MDNEVYIVVANYSLISEPNYLFPNSSMLSVMLFKNMEQNVLINKYNIKFRYKYPRNHFEIRSIYFTTLNCMDSHFFKYATG